MRSPSAPGSDRSFIPTLTAARAEPQAVAATTRLVSQNITAWGPAALSALKGRWALASTAAIIGLSEHHLTDEELHSLLPELEAIGFIAQATTTRPSTRSLKAGGVMQMVRDHYEARW